MGHPIKSLSNKIYPEVRATYQALGAMLVRMLSARWERTRDQPIYDFLFLSVPGAIANSKKTDSVKEGSWEKTWRNWGKIAGTSNPFLGNNPRIVGEVIEWAVVTEKLITDSEAKSLLQMFATLINWEEAIQFHPESIHDDVIFIIDTAAQFADLELTDGCSDILKSADLELTDGCSDILKSAYLDNKTGDLFDFTTLNLVKKGNYTRVQADQQIRDAAFQLMRVGENLAAAFPPEGIADEQKWDDSPLPANKQTVQFSLLTQQGQALLEHVYRKSGGIGAASFINAMKEKLKELEKHPHSITNTKCRLTRGVVPD